MKHTADSGAFLLCPDSPLRSKQKAKSGAARKRGANLCIAQLRGEGTQIDPHGLRRKPKMPKIINLGNCVKLLWFTTFCKEVVNLIEFLVIGNLKAPLTCFPLNFY